jgi:hypothetical protein
LVMHCMNTCLHVEELRSELLEFLQRHGHVCAENYGTVCNMVLHASVIYAGSHGHHWIWAAEGLMRAGLHAGRWQPRYFELWVGRWLANTTPQTLQLFPAHAMDVILDMAMWHAQMATLEWTVVLGVGVNTCVSMLIKIFSMVTRLEARSPAHMQPPSLECKTRYTLCVERFFAAYGDCLCVNFGRAGTEPEAESVIILAMLSSSHTRLLGKWRELLQDNFVASLDLAMQWTPPRSVWVAAVVRAGLGKSFVHLFE